MAVAWQGKTIDAILDEGSYGLQYWIKFMPLYEAAFGGNGGRGISPSCWRCTTSNAECGWKSWSRRGKH